MCWPRSVPWINLIFTRFSPVIVNAFFWVCLSELSPQAPGAPDGNRLVHQQRQHHHAHSDWLWLWDRLHGASDCTLTHLYDLKLCRPSVIVQSNPIQDLGWCALVFRLVSLYLTSDVYRLWQECFLLFNITVIHPHVSCCLLGAVLQ